MTPTNFYSDEEIARILEYNLYYGNDNKFAYTITEADGTARRVLYSDYLDGPY